MIEREYFDELLDGLAQIKHTKISAMMGDIFYEKLKDINGDLFLSAIQALVDESFFPTPERIREVATGVTIDQDWYEIMAVASGSKSSAEISGIAGIALKSIGGIKTIAIADERNTDKLRSQFLKLLSIPTDPKTLPPAKVTIKVGTEERGSDPEYPIDWDFSVRTASLIRLLNKREIKTSTAIAMCSRFPAVKKAEVMAIVEEIEGKSGVESSPSKTGMSIDFAGII
jgi:hypothetical protein